MVVETFPVSKFGNSLDYLQYLVFQMSTCKDLLQDILIDKSPGYTYTVENYDYFMNEFRESKIKYDYEYLEFLLNHLPQYFGDLDYSSNIVFTDNIFEIIYEPYEEKINGTLIETIDIDGTDDAITLRYLIIENNAYEEIYRDIIKAKKPEYGFIKETYNKFMDDYKKIKTEYGVLFQHFLNRFASKYASSQFYAVIDINYMTLNIYKIN